MRLARWVARLERGQLMYMPRITLWLVVRVFARDLYDWARGRPFREDPPFRSRGGHDGH